MRCTYCGKKIVGKKPKVSGEEGPLIYFEGDTEIEVEPGRKINFCSDKCAWEYGMEEHMYMGEKEAKNHLIELHGLKPERR